METVETTRRGFLGLLAGTVLGKVLGPRIIPAPSVQTWESAVLSPPLPIENTYLTLEQMAAGILRVVDQELKSLRLERYDSEGNRRIGEQAVVRYPQPWPFGKPWSIERNGIVLLDQQCHVGFQHLTDLCEPWDKFDKHYIEPAGRALAEHVIRTARQRGGAEVIVSAKPRFVPGFVPAGANQCVVASFPSANLHLLAVRAFDHLGRRPEEHLRFDLLYGLA